MVRELMVCRWWSSVFHVTSKPTLLLSMSIIGCLMLWIASKQVKSAVQALAYLQLIAPGQVNKLPERPRYFLFGLLTLIFVWLDLFLCKKLLQSVAAVVTWSKKMLLAKEGPANPDLCRSVAPRPRPTRATRKNPVRACRSTGRRFMGF